MDAPLMIEPEDAAKIIIVTRAPGLSDLDKTTLAEILNVWSLDVDIFPKEGSISVQFIVQAEYLEDEDDGT